MNRLAHAIEQCAGLLLGAVALLTVVEVVLRQLIGLQVPDAYTLAGYFQGIAIFWGIALAILAGRHITVDALWTACGPRMRVAIDILATLLSTLALTALTFMMARKVISTYHSGETTYELGLLIWPLLLGATVGAGLGVLFGLIRLRRLTHRLAEPTSPPSTPEAL